VRDLRPLVQRLLALVECCGQTLLRPNAERQQLRRELVAMIGDEPRHIRTRLLDREARSLAAAVPRRVRRGLRLHDRPAYHPLTIRIRLTARLHTAVEHRQVLPGPLDRGKRATPLPIDLVRPAQPRREHVPQLPQLLTSRRRLPSRRHAPPPAL
jgi:hypothetical protein